MVASQDCDGASGTRSKLGELKTCMTTHFKIGGLKGRALEDIVRACRHHEDQITLRTKGDLIAGSASVDVDGDLPRLMDANILKQADRRRRVTKPDSEARKGLLIVILAP